MWHFYFAVNWFEFVGILMYQSVSALLHFWELYLEALGLNTFNHPWQYLVSYVYPLILIPILLLKFLAEHVIGQFRLPILVVPCCIKVLWLLTILNMWWDVPDQCHVVKVLIREAPVDWVLKGLPSLYLTLWLLSGVCCTDSGSLP